MRAALTMTLKDSGFFKLFKAFLEDRGQLIAGQTGYYSRPQSQLSSPAIIVFGSPESVTSGAGHLALPKELLNSNVIFHEVLHYALDKIDHYTSETVGWDDHASFDPIETRFRIVQTLKAGISPLMASSNIGRALDRYALDDWASRIDHPHLTYYFQQNPSPTLLDEVANYLQRPDFDKKYVDAAMIWNLMSSSRYPDCPPEKRIYEDEDLRDLAYAHALNARLIIDATQMAQMLGDRYGLAPFEIYPTEEFQYLFDEYRKALLQSQTSSEPEGLKMSSQRILRDLMKPQMTRLSRSF
jgi:hypothetical protein